eukprot:TRINITY_DN72543_c0_g1_i1.p1 TRINITY_DN72543_c0_g1~~TRINITY_DN72543_c0_g1_i1.p1  ORF type:complete len:476 (+),score=100.70 TRINITY_DN72543_c0_g1_i1:71-1429(+)
MSLDKWQLAQGEAARSGGGPNGLLFTYGADGAKQIATAARKKAELLMSTATDTDERRTDRRRRAADHFAVVGSSQGQTMTFIGDDGLPQVYSGMPVGGSHDWDYVDATMTQRPAVPMRKDVSTQDVKPGTKGPDDDGAHALATPLDAYCASAAAKGATSGTSGEVRFVARSVRWLETKVDRHRWVIDVAGEVHEPEVGVRTVGPTVWPPAEPSAAAKPAPAGVSPVKEPAGTVAKRAARTPPSVPRKGSVGAPADNASPKSASVKPEPADTCAGAHAATAADTEPSELPAHASMKPEAGAGKTEKADAAAKPESLGVKAEAAAAKPEPGAAAVRADADVEDDGSPCVSAGGRRSGDGVSPPEGSPKSAGVSADGDKLPGSSQEAALAGRGGAPPDAVVEVLVADQIATKLTPTAYHVELVGIVIPVGTAGDPATTTRRNALLKKLAAALATG